jgi:ParB-like nuclease domain
VSRGHLVLEHAIDEISVGYSFRRDVEEDLDELCASIERFGVIHPPTVTEQYALISGRRVLAAQQRLGYRVTPIWIVHGVSDKLSHVLAIRDEETLRKALKPIEQAELYSELKQLYAEENARKQEATQFGAHPDNSEAAAPTEDGGGVDSTPPQTVRGEGAKTRVRAAKAVTGRDSHGMLDQVVELKQIAASDTEHPQVRQAAAEALLELNTDGKVNGRYLRVKLLQAVTLLEQWAGHPDEPDAIREAAAAELQLVRAQEHPKDALKEATRAIGRLTPLRKDAAAAVREGWSDADPLLRQKHQIRKLVDLLRREHGWWERYSPEDFGAYADDEQWELVETSIVQAGCFLDIARTSRETRNDAEVADAHV